jgi:tetratricopeptide (TPR) repeat protein
MILLCNVFAVGLVAAQEADIGVRPIVLSDEERQFFGEENTPPAGESAQEYPESGHDDADAPVVKSGSGAADEVQDSSSDRPTEHADSPSDRDLFETISLDGIGPGRTTSDELHARWGFAWKTEPITGGVRELYTNHSPDQLRVTIVGDIVKSVVQRLSRPLAADVIAKRMNLDEFEPVEVLDEHGQVSGRAYLERGVVLRFSSPVEEDQVSQIIIETIEAKPFISRAEARLPNRYAECMKDINQALKLAPDSGRAYWLRAEVELRSGHLEAALKSVKRAMELQSTEPEYVLTLARIVAASGDYEEAIQQASSVAKRDKVPAVVAARAHCLWGDYLAAGQAHDYQQAIHHHTQAVKLAKPLKTSRKPHERRQAKEVLIDAHLAVAHDIGWGVWDDQTNVAVSWIDRATDLADEFVTQDNGSLEVLLRVNEQAVLALAGIVEPPVVTKWAAAAIELGKTVMGESSDSTYRARLNWYLGTMLSDVLQIEKSLGHREQALEMGKLSLTHLELGEAFGKQLPLHDYLRGRAYYRLGALSVVNPADNNEAVIWFDKAVALLESQPTSVLVDCGRQGEMLASMAVAYWEVENRKEALRLTNHGIKMMEKAVSKDLLAGSALAKPYRNLSVMHQRLGDRPAAKRFAEIAARYDETKTK